MSRHTKRINGVTSTSVHAGQKHAYGDSFYEYDILSDHPPEEVERVCAADIHSAIPIQQWRDENRAKPSMDNHFRSHYVFQKRGDGKYFYQVISPYMD